MPENEQRVLYISRYRTVEIYVYLGKKYLRQKDKQEIQKNSKRQRKILRLKLLLCVYIRVLHSCIHYLNRKE